MENIIESFHLDWKLLLAQAINFAIVISLLYFYALKPLTKVLSDRSSKIETSLKEAREIGARLERTEADYEAKLTEAKKEAAEIVAAARTRSEAKEKEMIAKAKEEIGRIINDEKAMMQQEKARTLQEIKSEAADLIALALERVLETKAGGKEDRDLIARAVKDIK